SFAWSASAGGATSSAVASSVSQSLGLSSVTSASLSAAPFTLPYTPASGSLSFSLTAAYPACGSSCPGRSHSVSVVVSPSPLLAHIAGGATRSLSTNDTLVLDATASFDPDAGGSAVSYSYSYAWSLSGTAHSSSPAAVSYATVAGSTLTPGTLT